MSENKQSDDLSDGAGLDRLGIAMSPQCVGEWPRPASAPEEPDPPSTLKLVERIGRRLRQAKLTRG